MATYGKRSGWIVQVWPSHDSAKATVSLGALLPTAMQAWAEVQETSVREVVFAPAGLRGDPTDQLSPSHDAAAGKVLAFVV